MDRNELTRKFEPLQPFVLLEMARVAGSEIFIDIGANIGVYSVFFSSLPSVSKIVAIEASPETFQELSKNVAYNDPDGKIELQNFAVSNNSEPCKFGIINGLSGANSIVDTSIHDSEKFTDVITVESKRLDELFELRDRNICIKIDVEGHEASVIAGAASTLTDNRCIIQMENYADDAKVVKKLIEQGFHVCFSVGPDVYLTNDSSIGGAEQFLQVFEAASTKMIASNLNPPERPRKVSERHRFRNDILSKVGGPFSRLVRALAGNRA